MHICIIPIYTYISTKLKQSEYFKLKLYKINHHHHHHHTPHERIDIERHLVRYFETDVEATAFKVHYRSKSYKPKRKFHRIEMRGLVCRQVHDV